MRRTIAVSLSIMVLLAGPANADWIVRPFIGASVGTSHGFVDLDRTVGTSKPFWGVAVGWQPSNLGIEVEWASAPGFLASDGDLVERGRLATATANVTWRLPLFAESARLRPYLSGGAGVMQVTLQDALHAFSATSVLVAGNAGGGVNITLTPRVSINGELRYFRSRVGEQHPAGFGQEFVAYSRLSTGVVVGF